MYTQSNYTRTFERPFLRCERVKKRIFSAYTFHLTNNFSGGGGGDLHNNASKRIVTRDIIRIFLYTFGRHDKTVVLQRIEFFVPHVAACYIVF